MLAAAKQHNPHMSLLALVFHKKSPCAEVNTLLVRRAGYGAASTHFDQLTEVSVPST